ncbi:MAG: crotonase/enoyl-CoA hydratase family protein [Caulobacterales bacterium]
MILIEKNGPIALLTLNRPESLNALGLEGDGPAVRAACEQINNDLAIRCTILTGAGRAFSSGGDLKAMKERTGAFAGGLEDIREGYRRNIHEIVRSLYNLQTPLISAINGAAIGLGCDVACTGDLRIAANSAKFGATFLKIGLIPGDGGAWLLPRLIGDARAARLLFTGDVIDAETAKAWGLVSDIYPASDLMAQAFALAEKVAAQPPQALRMAKSLLRQGVSASFDAIMEMSAASQARMHQTEDHMEGVTAMLEKRPPNFIGR